MQTSSPQIAERATARHNSGPMPPGSPEVRAMRAGACWPGSVVDVVAAAACARPGGRPVVCAWPGPVAVFAGVRPMRHLQLRFYVRFIAQAAQPQLRLFVGLAGADGVHGLAALQLVGVVKL